MKCLKHALSTSAIFRPTNRTNLVRILFDPVEREVRDVEHAQKLGLDRREYNRRQALILKVCPLDSGYANCYKEVYKTGKEPELLKPSQYGTPVNN
jgi:hypothetical protein